ncbi:MAG: C10 family peptidase [Bacteroidales bacterium]|nr:C10 family peptidase [Bacteroidales bacterium]
MRKIILTVVATLVAASAFGDKVSVERAEQVASNFWRQETGSIPRLTELSAEANLSELYLFDVDGGKGYVVIAGDDVAYPVLAYSVSSGFPTGNIAPSVMYMLRYYENQIIFARDLGGEAMPDVTKEWSDLENGIALEAKTSREVPQMMTSKWSQNEPYNDKCPKASGQERCVTGCVATAMAQVMRYWQYPVHGVGQHSYSYNDRPVAVTHMLGDSSAVWLYDTLTVDYENTFYDWENMPDIATPASPETEKDAVSTLVYHCGVAVDMVYTPNGSGAFMTRQEVLNFDSVNYSTEIAAEVVIPQYFGYSENTKGLLRSDYETTEWLALLKNELSNGRPIIYAGNDPGSDYGHAFVLDGYNTRTFFHCNFGWGGVYDGDFRIDEIAPERGGHAFTDKQSGIFWMYPPGEGFFEATISCTGAASGGVVLDGETAVCDSTIRMEIGQEGRVLKIVAERGFLVGRVLADKDTLFRNNTIFEGHDISCSIGEEPRTVICDFSNRKRDVNLKVMFVVNPDEDPLSITEAGGEGATKVTANGKKIELKGGAIGEVNVYDVIGRRVATHNAHGENSATIEINKCGLYIVRCGNEAHKVLVH